MKLEAGKLYVRRDGTVTTPLEPWGDAWIKDPETLMLYDPYDSSEGHLVRPATGEEDPLDLVEPYEGHGEAP